MSTQNATAPIENVSQTMDKILDCDVLIVGAATAGAAAAYYMASAGLKVKVIEKQKLPQTGVCGYFASPGAVKELEKIGVTKQPGYQQINLIEGATIYIGGKEINRGVFPNVKDMPNYALVFPGKTLETSVLEVAKTAGAVVEDETCFLNYAVEKDWVTVAALQRGEMRTYRARLLVGADGANSAVARLMLGKEWSKVERAVVARAYFKDVVGFATEANAYFNSDSLPGYAWVFPARDGEANVGLGVALGGTPEPEDIKELFKKTLEKDDGLNLRLHGAKMVSEIEVRELNLYDPTVPLVSDRVMLVGLAAGLANPFNGEGIQLGLLSAKWAAETAKWCMQNRNFSALLLSGYPRHINHELGGGYKVSALIMSLLRNRRLNDTWLEWLTYMGQKTVDDSDYLDLISSVLSGMVFPDEETSMKAFLGSLEEAAKKKGVNILQNSQNMQNIAGDNRDAAQYVAQNPIAAILFGVDALTKATEIAASLSKKTFKETNPSQEPQHQQ